jgi:hypothetical protein
MRWNDSFAPPVYAHIAGPLVRWHWTDREQFADWHMGQHDGECPKDSSHLMVWHDCSKILGPESVAPGERFGWVASGVAAHTVTQIEPLTLVASVYWPDCCGLHGFITDGVWVGA